ncbi:MAG: VWA domain-containing protein [Nocardioidaceae bacterium]
MADAGSQSELAFEPAAFAVRFCGVLHRAGVLVTPEAAGRFAQALRLVPPTCRERLYWAARVTLVSEQSQHPLFDRVFAAVFDGMLDPADSRGDTSTTTPVVEQPRTRPPTPDARTVDGPRGSAVDRSGAMAGRPGESDDQGSTEREAILAAASPDERLAQTAFADMDPEQVIAVRQLVRQIVLATPTRRSRRTRRSNRAGERVDLRRTLRRAQHSGGDPARLVRRTRKDRPRQLVLLCDVSGSMESCAHVFLTLMQGAVTQGNAEAFVFATRLTRLTSSLAGRDVQVALARAAESAPDWAGGTRLGANLCQLVDRYGHRRIVRGAVVVILSDGWECGDPQRLAVQMARLRRRAYRIVWVNPRKAAPGYAPLVGGMAAALPHCDAFVSGHSLSALAEVAAAVGTGRSGYRLRERQGR